MSRDLDAAIARYLDGEAAAEEVAWLDARLQADPAARRRFVAMASTMGLLADAVRSGGVLAGPRPAGGRRWWRRLAIAAGALAAVLAAGILLLPAEPAGPRLEGWSGAVVVVRDRERLQPLAGMELRRGDRVDTPAGGEARLRWHDRASIALAAASSLACRQEPSGPLLELCSGRIDVDVGHGGGREAPLRIAAGGWRIRDIGTTFAVMLGSDGPRVEVADGTVEVSSAASVLRVERGQGAEAGGDGGPVLVAAGGRPFADDSRWNRGLRTGAAPTPLPAGSLAAPDWTTTWPRIEMLDARPGATEVERSEGGSLGRIGAALPDGQDAFRPADFLCLRSADGRRMWELSRPARTVDGRLSAERLVEVDLRGDGRVGILPSGLPACAGAITAGDVRTGADHALAIHPTAAMWEAAGLVDGERLVLAGPAEPGGDPLRAMLERTLRRHGAIVAGRANQPQIAVDPRLPEEIRTAIARIIADLAPRLHRTANEDDK